jgi:hypothetical protein
VIDGVIVIPVVLRPVTPRMIIFDDESSQQKLPKQSRIRSMCRHDGYVNFESPASQDPSEVILSQEAVLWLANTLAAVIHLCSRVKLW